MPFTMMGTEGRVRFRLYPKPERGSNGIGVTHIKPTAKTTRTSTPKPVAQKRSFTSRVATSVRSLFGRGNR